MNSTWAVWMVVGFALLTANLPFLSERLLFVGPRRHPKPMAWRLFELLLLAALALAVGFGLESFMGQRQPQGWEFYVAWLCLFATLAFPGFVWRHLRRTGSAPATDSGPPMADKHLIEVCLQEHQLVRGSFLEVRRDTVRLPDATQATREFVVHPGAVMIVPLLDDGRLVMERQFRYPLGQVILEFPAGKIDPGEDRLNCARRELLEETGYRATQWRGATLIHNAPAYSTELIEIWFARGLIPGPQRLDVGEALDVCLCSPEQLEAMAAAGELTDVKSLVGLLWLQKWQAGLWPLDWQYLEP